jgi:AraC-like DNA-binding protein
VRDHERAARGATLRLGRRSARPGRDRARLAHSLTLAWSVFGWIALRPPPVEVCIAMSIVLVASQALREKETLARRLPALVSFLFEPPRARGRGVRNRRARTASRWRPSLFERAGSASRASIDAASALASLKRRMSVSVVVVRGLLEAVEAARVDRSELLAAVQFDPERLSDVDGRVPQAEYDALVERALDLTGDPSLGLRMGFATTSFPLSLNAQLIFQATSLREGLKLADRFYRLFTDERPLFIEEGARTIVVKATGVSGTPRCRRFASELTMSGLYKLLQFFSPQARAEMVAFEYPAPAPRSDYTKIFHGTERFEQSFTGLVIDRRLMDAQASNRDDDLHAVLRSEAAKRLAKIEQVVTYSEKVREYVSTLPVRAHDIAAVSRALGIGARSLRRRLAEEGSSFSEVVDRSLAAVAIRLLIDEQKSIQEAAQQMSFSEASAFSRAFKRWTSATPTEYKAASSRAPRTRDSRPSR